jgi:RHS repeat-associated protein
MWIDAVKLYYYKARMYSPVTARFLQPDPIGYDGGINLYAYAADDPMNMIDPTGLDPVCVEYTYQVYQGDWTYRASDGVWTIEPVYEQRTGKYCFDPPGRAGGGGRSGGGGNGGGGPPQEKPDPKKCWATGINFEFSTINPFTSGGGGSYGVNIEWTAGDGLAIYTYGTPQKTPSKGFLVGPSITANAAVGKGGWSGPFDSAAGSFSVVSGGAFWSTPGADDPGYFGLNLGVGKGPPGLGVTTTTYTKRAQVTHPAPNNCTEPRS